MPSSLLATFNGIKSLISTPPHVYSRVARTFLQFRVFFSKKKHIS